MKSQNSLLNFILILGLISIFSVCVFSEPEDNVKVVAQDLNSSDISERIKAVKILSNQTSPDTINTLIKALKDENWRVRSEAANALEKIKDPSSVDAILEQLEAESLSSELDTLFVGNGETTVAHYTRQQLANALTEIVLKEVTLQKNTTLSKLKHAFARSKNKIFKYYLATPLAYMRQPEVDPLLIEILQFSKDGNLRANAAQLLGVLGDKKAIPVLKKALNDSYRSPYKGIYIVRDNAASSLQLLGLKLERIGTDYKVIEEPDEMYIEKKVEKQKIE